MPTDDLAPAIAALADDETKSLVNAFVREALSECRFLLRHGATPIKIQLIRTVLSATMKDVGKGEGESEVVKELREQVTGLMQEVRGDLTGGSPLGTVHGG